MTTCARRPTIGAPSLPACCIGSSATKGAGSTGGKVTAGGRRALERAIAAWNRGDGEAYLALYAPQIVLHSGSMGDMHGLDEVAARYGEVWKAFDSRIEIDDLVAEGDTVACRYRWTATSRDGGRPFTVPGMTVLHFDGDQCVERWDLEGQASRRG